ncbi:3'5'-cyclic nucleotide phosphodiesterase domain-containing protein [Ditylenchus destructor]|uniref:Phosphodiesterase n=1 Tax=Ditylenchus destructor TaxID=166010 RepID=A0AAD4RAP6_9BILA|nr:3'5'-cyclic nucleotide phosphodiesterase domain-containing protein [Ditylenchus destructor]
MPKKSTGNVHNHNDPLLYTALFKRKFVKVFTGGSSLAPIDATSPNGNVSQNGLRDSISCSIALNGGVDLGGGRTPSPTPPSMVRASLSALSLRKSPCLENCLACDNDKASNRRVSNITFSTVTSATGLPTIAAEPSRPRSSSYWKPQQHIKQECSVTSASVPHIPSDNGSGGGVQMTGKTECKSTVNNIKSTDDSTELATASRKSEEENALTSSVAVSSLPSQSTAIAQTVQQQNKIGGANSSKLFNNITGNLKDGSASTTPISSPQFRRLEGLQNSNKNVTTSGVEANPTSNHVPSTAEEQLERRRRPPLRLNDTSANKAVNFHKKHLKHTESKITEEEADLSSEQSTSSGATEDSQLLVIKTADGNVFDRSELERDEYLRRISEWGFPIFAFAERHNRTVLSRITYAIFKEANLFRIFKLSPTKFFNFFHSLESGYWDIPYHNRIHAADVLHGTFYLTCHPVRAFVGRPSTPETPEIALDSAPLPLSQSMNTLELMALFTAAAMHDFDHPGRTNAFLVASEDKKAILYNDRSVLENHHAAESWRLLCQSQNNFIENLDSAETKRFRYLVLEYILATDLKQHFDIIMQFNEKAPDIDLTNESDRVLLSQMLIKFADINSPAKPYPLHRQWTERICQEFYEQGDEEQQRKMPVSPYMDRQHPAVAKLQDSFIAHIVNPLAVALNEAGLLPVLPGLEEPELIINLKHNHSKWLYEIEEEQSSFEGESTTSEEGSVIENNSVLNQNNNCENKGQSRNKIKSPFDISEKNCQQPAMDFSFKI